jgi:hypothetical protein
MVRKKNLPKDMHDLEDITIIPIMLKEKGNMSLWGLPPSVVANINLNLQINRWLSLIRLSTR